MRTDATIRQRLARGAAITVFGGQFAALGWLAGHTLTYLIVDPTESTPAERHMHAYLPAVGSVGMVLLALAVVAQTLLLIRGWAPLREWVRPTTHRHARGQWLAAALVPAGAYVGAEILERVVPGVYWFPGWLLLLVGVPIQMAIGAALFAVARLVARGLSKLVALLRRRPARTRSAAGPLAARVTQLHGLGIRTQRSRGPPSVRRFSIL